MIRWRNRGPVLGLERRWIKATGALVALLGLGTVAALGVELAQLRLRPEPGSEMLVSKPGGGALLICGGGKLPQEVRDQFLALAGGRGARIVVIPTAHRSADGPDAGQALEMWKGRGAESVKLLHTRSRDRANDAEFVRPLVEATGVWIGGGSQSLVTGVYAGTEVERQLKALLDRGGVIGGSSAGAAVMTRVMIESGRREAIVGQGFDLLPGAVIDQHFLRRNRVGRLLGVLAGHPDLIGFGIDEGTALVVRPRDRHLRVIGDSYVVACVPGASTGQPPRFEILKRGDETDLTALRQPDANITSAIDLDEAVLSSH
jgi:cyanophycinase